MVYKSALKVEPVLAALERARSGGLTGRTACCLNGVVVVEVAKRRFSAEDFHRMALAGIFRPEDRVELIDGEIIEMSPIGKAHAACVNRLNRSFSDRLRSRVLVSVQNPVRLAPESEPQPDIALLRPRADDYAGAHPGPEDVLLLVEVADTTQAYDRDVKAPLYARAGIKEVWLVDLAAARVEVFRRPEAGRYADAARRSRGERLSPLSFPDCALAVDEILG